MAQDDYYYEIQLTNKQLIFYFLAGATGLVLSFLAGVMVGRGVDASEPAVQPLREERIVSEEPPPSPPPAEELTYARDLESERSETSLERPRPLSTPVRRADQMTTPAPSPGGATPAPGTATPAPAPAATTTPAATPTRVAAATPTPAPAATPTPAPAATPPPARAATPAPAARLPRSVAPSVAGSFSIQVGAFKDRAGADGVMVRLKAKGYPAYVVASTAGDGLFNVRVGGYVNRADAEAVQGKLRDQERFQPFIVKP